MIRALLLTFLLAAAVNAQWEIQSPKYYGTDYMDLHFTTDNEGFIFTFDGELLKSTDAGDTWFTSYYDSTNPVRGMYFFDSDHGWLLANTHMLKTTNGGVTWLPINKTASRIQFISSNSGLAITTYNGALIKTTNGGETWDTVLTREDFPGNFANIYYFNENNVIVTTSLSDYLYRSTDGGGTWEKPMVDTTDFCRNYQDISKVVIINDSVGYYNLYGVEYSDDQQHYCPPFSQNYKTTNAGYSWQPYEDRFDKFDADNFAWTSRDYSTDGGITWHLIPKPHQLLKGQYYFVNKNLGFEYGAHGFILKTTDLGANWYSLHGNYNNLYGGDFFNEELGWAVGENTILKTTNGGKDWRIITDSIEVHFNGVSFINANTGYAVGNTFAPRISYIYKSTDGGESWNKVCELNKDLELRDITFLDETTGYMNARPGFYKTTNGGASWEDILPGSSKFEFIFLDKLTGWICDANSLIKTTNGGSTWSVVLPERVHAVYFINPDTGWISKNDGVFKTTDGGITWVNQINYYLADDRHQIRFLNDKYGFISAGEYMYETTNGGDDWTSFLIPRYQLFHNGTFTTYKNHIWFFNVLGIIMHNTIPDSTNADETVTSVTNTLLPTQYALEQNYPNPFNPGTTIKYALPEASFVKLVVYNSLGEVVKILVNDNKSEGYYETVFDAKNLSSGMYIYRLEAGNFVSTAKMILLK